MLYPEAIDWLFSLHRFGMKLGLENIRALTEALGRPQGRFDSVLIAGTNGKGSTAAMLHQVLVASGLRSGLYTSPHLVRTEERIRIGDREIGSAELAGAVTEVRAAIDRLLAAGALSAHPTFFEVMTACALMAFARAEVAVAILEVGLGGRFDATNVVTPILSIITNIDLDHQEQLGSTLTAIAREKAGILRAGVTALVGEEREEPLSAIQEEEQRVGADLVLAGDGGRTTGCRVVILEIDAARSATKAVRAETEAVQAETEAVRAETEAVRAETKAVRAETEAVRAETEAVQAETEALRAAIEPARAATEAPGVAATEPGAIALQGRAGVPPGAPAPEMGTPSARARAPAPGLSLLIETPVRRYNRIDCPLPGAHQGANALLAVRAAELLSRAWPAIDARAIAAGIAAARWPGRLEWIEGRPALLLDGAHNPAGAKALAEYLRGLGVKPVLLFGAMRDKDLRGMLAALLPRVASAVFTRPPMERAADPASLVETARAIEPVGTYRWDSAVSPALARARALAGPRGLVLVAGSLFLVGAVKETLEAPALRSRARP